MNIDDLIQQPGRWITWCRIQAGNDGRRPSGTVYTRTKTAHFISDDRYKTLCGLAINLFPKIAGEAVVRCRACLNRVAETKP